MTTPYTPMDCSGLADSLADYLEGDAPEMVRDAIDAHAAGCDDCRTLLAELRGISASAASLPMLEPSRDLWAGIAERIDAPVLPLGSRTVRVLDARRTWLRPAAAAAALVIATAGITHYLTRATYAPAVQQVAARTSPQESTSSVPTSQPVAHPAAQPATVAAPQPTAEFSSTATERAPRTPVVAVSRTNESASRSPGATSAAPLMGDAEPVYDSEIGKLRRIVKQRRNDLDPRTVAVLEQSIAVIDSAIAQSRAALRKDPASGFLANQLNHSLEKKVELLRTAAMLPART